MEPKKLSSLIVLCILVTASRCQNTTPRPKTDGCCFGRVARDIIALINYGNGTNETECTKQCISNDTCVGVDWRSNSGTHDECKLFITMKNVIQRSVVNCADNHLSYCWKVKAGVHQDGGKHDRNITDEADCKRICVDNTNCTVVVWNADKKECWILLHKHDTTTSTHKELVNHWTIVRDLPRTFQETTGNIEFMPELITESYSSYNGSTTQKWTKEETINIVLAALLGVWTLIIVIGISIYAVKLKKCCSTQKKVDKVKVVDVAKVVEPKVNDYGEAKEDDDESYIDYQDLRRLENPPTTCEEEGCEYTAMELENMKELEDDDNIYYNEDQ